MGCSPSLEAASRNLPVSCERAHNDAFVFKTVLSEDESLNELVSAAYSVAAAMIMPTPSEGFAPGGTRICSFPAVLEPGGEVRCYFHRTQAHLILQNLKTGFSEEFAEKAKNALRKATMP